MRYFVALALAACSGKRDAEPVPVPGPPVPPVPPPAVGRSVWADLPEPPERSNIVISTNRIDGPPERAWSWLSAYACSSMDDPYEFAESSNDELRRAGVRCGRALFEHLPPNKHPAWVNVDPSTRDHPSRLVAVPTTYDHLAAIEALVVGFHRETVGGATLLCRPDEPTRSTCSTARDEAIALVGGHVVSGNYEAIAGLLRHPDIDRAFTILAHGPEDADIYWLAKGTPWQIASWLPWTTTESGEISEAVAKTARVVVRDVAWERGRGSIVLVPRCSTAACPERATLAAALRAYQRAWVTGAPATLRDAMGDHPGKDADCALPLETAMIEEVARSEVVATDDVELRFALPATLLPKVLAARAPCAAPAKSDDAAVARVRAAM